MFEANRTWFPSVFVIWILLDIVVTALRDQTIPETFLLAYLGHYIVIGVVGIFVRKRLYDLIAAWYVAITMASWSFGVRGTLFQ